MSMSLYIKHFFRVFNRKKVLSLCLLFAVSGVVILGCSSRSVPANSERPMKRTTFSFDQGSYPSDLDLFTKYKISPGDVLDIIYQIRRTKVESFPITLYHTVSVKFVNMSDLNETQKVMPNGEISLPYLGGVKVTGKTPQELSEELEERYSSILRDPEIYVKIPDFTARVEQLRNDLHTSARGLSKLVTVRPDGYATFPLIGEFMVARKTISRVNEIIQAEYQKILPGMQADLFLHEQSGSVIYMAGAVQNSGRYEISKPITVMQALALAGGGMPNAELRNVVVFRKHEKKRIARSLNLKNITSADKKSAFFYLKPDDLVYVPKTRISKLAQLMQQVSQVTMFNGWSYGLGETVDWIGPNREDNDN